MIRFLLPILLFFSLASQAQVTKLGTAASTPPTFTLTDGSGWEGTDEYIAFAIAKTGQRANDSSYVQFTVSSGTATLGSDFADTTIIIGFHKNEYYKIAYVRIIDDSQDEDAEGFNAALTILQNGRLARGNAGGWILDNDENIPTDPAAVITYYLDPVNGSNTYTTAQAQNPQTPWKSFAAVTAKSLTIAPGTHFSLKGGSYGPEMLSYNSIPMTLAINNDRGWQGTYANPIVIKALPGHTPVFTSYKTATGGTAVPGKPGVFAYVVDVFEELSVVEIDGYVRECGRYPERTSSGQRGYLMGRTKSGGAQNQTATLAATFIPPYSLVGGDVVTRANDYQGFSHQITGQTQNTVSFFNTAFSHLEDQFGTYFQNHLNLLNSNYDWAFKRGTTDTLYVYFADGNPARHTVRYASANYLSWLMLGKYIQFKGITFEGANVHGVKIQTAQKIAFDSCHWVGFGRNAIWQVNGADSTVIRYNMVKHAFAGAFDLGSEAHSIIEYNTLDSISVFAARPTRNVEVVGSSQVGTFTEGFHGEAAIIARGAGAKINHNTIRYAGFNGITWNGAGTIVNGNYINYAVLRATDLGGIYSFNKGLPDYTAGQVRTVSNNTILNVVGDPGGTPNTNYAPVFGIYNDDETNRVNITGNTIGFATRGGIYNHHTQYIAASGNRIFDSEYGYYTRYGDNDSQKLPVGNTFTGDVIVSNKPGQIQNSFTVVNQGVFASLTPAQTATMTSVTYYPYSSTQFRVLIANASGTPAGVTYSGGPYTNLLTGVSIGASPVTVPGYSALFGYRVILP